MLYLLIPGAGRRRVTLQALRTNIVSPEQSFLTPCWQCAVEPWEPIDSDQCDLLWCIPETRGILELCEWHMPGGKEYYNSQRGEGDQLELIKNKTLWEAFGAPNQSASWCMHTGIQKCQKWRWTQQPVFYKSMGDQRARWKRRVLQTSMLLYNSILLLLFLPHS